MKVFDFNKFPVRLELQGELFIVTNIITGEVREYRDFNEAFVYLLGSTKEYVFSDDEIADFFTEEVPEEELPDVGERVGNTEFDKKLLARYQEIKRAAFKKVKIPLSGLSEQNTYMMLRMLTDIWQTGFYPENICKAEANKIFTRFLEGKGSEELTSRGWKKQQEFIKNSSGEMSYIIHGLETEKLSELLLAAMRIIANYSGEDVSYNEVKKRIYDRCGHQNADGEWVTVFGNRPTV